LFNRWTLTNLNLYLASIWADISAFKPVDKKSFIPFQLSFIENGLFVLWICIRFLSRVKGILVIDDLLERNVLVLNLVKGLHRIYDFPQLSRLLIFIEKMLLHSLELIVWFVILIILYFFKRYCLIPFVLFLDSFIK